MHDAIASDIPVPAAPTSLQRVGIIGNYLPRRCGIATFTTDLSLAIGRASPDIDRVVVAMNDIGRQHRYPPDVRFAIAEDDLAGYRRAAAFLNASGVDAVSLQHEYGIFGGPAGDRILSLLAALRMPIVTTLHTVLARPSPSQQLVMNALVRRSERLVVMSTHSRQLLQTVHAVPADRIDCIPHGVPTEVFGPGDKAIIGVQGKSVLLTFGLVSPDKGIEYVIDALPAIVDRFPDTVYIVLGATHPHVLTDSGERYRHLLEARAQALGVEEHVIFHDRFVSKEELGAFLAAADIYLTPYLNLEQSTSGTLAYAVGAGKAVVSTPYRYARELLDAGRGMLVPPRDATALATAVLELLGNGSRASQLRDAVAPIGREMTWPVVAQRHVESLERAVHDWSTQRATRRTSLEPPSISPTRGTFNIASRPVLDLTHLTRLTDDTGILQHACFSTPRYEEGYCLDDNARALLLTVRLATVTGGNAPLIRSLSDRYLAFVAHAFDRSTGRFRNFMSYQRHFTERQGSDDSHGRALWALGATVGHARDPGRASLAGELFHGALPAVLATTSPRAWAYALLGIAEYFVAFAGHRSVEVVREVLAERLFTRFVDGSDFHWPWFESALTYANARLPQALLVSGAAMQHATMQASALRALSWLADQERSVEGYYAPTGTNGFHHRTGARAAFDQQPVEACGMVAASCCAYGLTGDPRWQTQAGSAFEWFLGRNHLHQSVYDTETSGCRDGVHAGRLNENQGAESTLSYLLARVDMHGLDRARPRPPPPLPRST